MIKIYDNTQKALIQAVIYRCPTCCAGLHINAFSFARTISIPSVKENVFVDIFVVCNKCGNWEEIDIKDSSKVVF